MRALKIILIAAIIAAAVGGAYLIMSESRKTPIVKIEQAEISSQETVTEQGGA